MKIIIIIIRTAGAEIDNLGLSGYALSMSDRHVANDRHVARDDRHVARDDRGHVASDRHVARPGSAGARRAASGGARSGMRPPHVRARPVGLGGAAPCTMGGSLVVGSANFSANFGADRAEYHECAPCAQTQPPALIGRRRISAPLGPSRAEPGRADDFAGALVGRALVTRSSTPMNMGLMGRY